jgi:opacity protein-like surface antigen
MNMRKFAILSAALLLSSLAAARSAQSQGNERSWTAKPKFEIVASGALGYVFRFDDQGFGYHPNFGVGIEVPIWQRLRIGAEINRTFGFEPTPVKCGSILFAPGQPMPCVGSAREGVSSATAGSFTAAYFFGEGRVQPYLVGGISILSAKEFRATSIVHPDFVEFSENEISSTGIGPTFGGGLRVSINRHLSIRPEIRFADGTAQSALNLSQWRLSIGAAYGW